MDDRPWKANRDSPRLPPTVCRLSSMVQIGNWQLKIGNVLSVPVEIFECTDRQLSVESRPYH